jgi:endonuclease YncB( thermonuclease family)
VKLKQSIILLLPPIAVIAVWYSLHKPDRNVVSSGSDVAVRDIPTVTSVIDGDTFDIGEMRVRIWGIDAPELKQKCYNAASFWLCGEVAAQVLRNRILGKHVTCDQSGIDRDGREVARCKLDETDLGGFMVEGGWAVDWPKHSKGEYASVEASARAAGLGIFGEERK